MFKTRILKFLIVLACPVLPGVLPAQAQTPEQGPVPDLWAYTADTPLQRPVELGDQRAYTETELNRIEDSHWRSAAAVPPCRSPAAVPMASVPWPWRGSMASIGLP